MKALATNVHTSRDEQEWWHTSGATGEVDPNLLAPDPFQPRRFINPSELEELTISIGESGVRQRLTVSPLSLMPWIRADQVPPGTKLMIISGHRRQLGAVKAKKSTVPVETKTYASEKEHREDAALLNAQRASLSPLEEGYEIARRKGLGEHMDHIARSFGKTPVWAYDRLKLTRLSPKIQERMNPILDKNDILPTSVATDLGGVGVPSLEKLTELIDEYGVNVDTFSNADDHEVLQFAYQEALLQIIDEKEMSATVAHEFINGNKHTTGAMHHDANRRTPSKSHMMLQSLFKSISGHLVIAWDETAFSRALMMIDISEAEKLLLSASRAQSTLKDIVKHLVQALEHKRERTHYTTPRMMEPTVRTLIPHSQQRQEEEVDDQKTQKPHVRVAERPIAPSRAVPKVAPRLIPRSVLGPLRRYTTAPSTPIKPVRQVTESVTVRPGFKPVVANYWYEGNNRYVGGEINDPQRYIELWEHKFFKWQREGLPKPDHLPTLDEVRTFVTTT